MPPSDRSGPSIPAGILEYELPDGWQAFAGRTDGANDYVSLRLAKANDCWFHVRGMPGGHIVLRVPPDRDPDRARDRNFDRGRSSIRRDRRPR